MRLISRRTCRVSVTLGRVLTLHGPEGAAADGPGRFDHPDRIERRHHRRPGIQRLQREQGGRAQPRADLGGGSEGHRHPGKRAVARADRDRTREGSSGRGGHEGLRLDQSAPAHGQPGGDRRGGCLSRVVGQQLHDRQRGRRRRRPGATLTPARFHACPKYESKKIVKKLESRIAVITGGSSGIGLATAKRFVEEGAHVLLAGRREKELKEAVAFIKSNVTTVVGDVSRLEDLDRLYAVVKEQHGHIDIVFANAGAGTIAPLAVATEAHFDQTFDVNVKGLFFTVQKALPLFKDGGSIILNSSVSNVLGLAGFTAYAASKAAVRNFARGWTMELKDRNIRVNCMSPGAIETPALATTTGLTAEQAEQAVAQFTSQIPMARRGKPEEIAAAVTFLACDESSYITGVDLAVDGGMAQV